MDRATLELYDKRGMEWVATHARPSHRKEAVAFSRRVEAGAVRMDVGCGAGRYLPYLGAPSIALDGSGSMLEACRKTAPHALFVRGDLEQLPLARGSIGGAWSWMSHLHVPRARLPLALCDLHRALAVGAPFGLQVLHGDYEGERLPDDEIGGRFFAEWQPDDLADVVVGAGFDIEDGSLEVSGDELRLRAVRGRSLANTVGPGMRLLMCGVNASFYSADAGVGYARPGNRFWPAALASGIVDKDRDPLAALVSRGVGMTDFVKRPTRTAAEVTLGEYRQGLARLERLVEWLQPGAVCFVGLSGWRASVNPKAVAGTQPEPVGGRPAYVMPSTSGLNARTPLRELTDHLVAAAALADAVMAVRSPRSPATRPRVRRRRSGRE